MFDPPNLGEDGQQRVLMLERVEIMATRPPLTFVGLDFARVTFCLWPIGRRVQGLALRFYVNRISHG